MLAALLALTAAALFTGAAVYISIAEHPARLGLADAAALAQWAPSYRRATPMQAGLALLSAALGAWAWRDLGDPCLLVGALLVFAVVPFTLLVIMPTNKRLQATPPDAANAETRALLVRWGRLHWFRNLLGAAAVAAFLACLVTP
jgi:hypothetical protein